MTNERQYLELHNGVFEVRGPAGAGKTYRLIQDVRELIKSGRRCTLISFSNAAVDELKLRIGSDGVKVSTIHSFSWSLISPLISTLLRDPKQLVEFKPYAMTASDNEVTWDLVNKVVYDSGVPFFNAEQGILSLGHDDVLDLLQFFLSEMPIIVKLIANSMDVLIIDEYQDTNRYFLQTLLKKLRESVLIGLYGDPCQTIYISDLGSPSLNNMLDDSKAYHVTLTNNFRSDSKLVTYFNKVRHPFDGISQLPVSTHISEEVHLVVGDGQLSDSVRNKIIDKFSLKHSMTLSSTNYLALSAVGQGEIGKRVRANINSFRKANNQHAWQWNEFLTVDPMTPELTVINEIGELFSGQGYRQTQAVKKCFTMESISRVGVSNLDRLINYASSEQTQHMKEYFESGGLVWKDSAAEFISLLEANGVEFAKSINAFIDRLRKLNDSTTVFQSKGREFDDVILNVDTGKYYAYNWDKINFENSQTSGLTQSAKVFFLFYVGITRAKEKLVIYVNNESNSSFLEKIQKYTDLSQISFSDL
jgi:superfamily I DNA/RNA helicase